VTLKIRYSDFGTVTRSDSHRVPTRDEQQIVVRALGLVQRTDAGRRPIRLVGVSLHNLVGPGTAPDAGTGLPFDPGGPACGWTADPV
jgi:DNA polymerase-4